MCMAAHEHADVYASCDRVFSRTARHLLPQQQMLVSSVISGAWSRSVRCQANVAIYVVIISMAGPHIEFQMSSQLFHSMSRVMTQAVKGTHKPRAASKAQGTNT